MTLTPGRNKAVVRRFMPEVMEGRGLDAIDEVLAPDCVNRGMRGVDRAAFKAMLSATGAAISDMRFDIHNLVAEGDAAVARLTSEMTLATGSKIDARGLTYYGLAGGKFVEDDPIETPDLTQELAALMPHARAQR